MNSRLLTQQSDDYYRIERAIKYIEANFKSRPSLENIARYACLSKFHFERLFKRWAGISPLQFKQFLTLEYAKKKLADSESLLATSYDSGLSAPGRLHDLFVTFDAITPGEFKKQGAGIKIEYGILPTPLGQCLLAVTSRGICFLGFADKSDEISVLEEMYQSWPGASFVENKKRIASYIKQIFGFELSNKSQPFNLLVKGTNFQINVWRALLKIPPGNITSYRKIAEYIGKPTAYRAVGSAIADNPVAYLIPCHRVIAESGKMHGYRWGIARKKALLAREAGLGFSNTE